MTQSHSQPWQAFWQLLIAAPEPLAVARTAVAVLDDEFDFLAEPAAPAPIQSTAAAFVPRPERAAELDAFVAQNPDLPREASAMGSGLRDEAQLDRVDAAGALWLCRLILTMPAVALPENGPLVRLLQRAASSPDRDLVCAAADASAHLDARASQLALVARLHADPHSLGHAGIDRVLACLKQIADGRCVREMEALLVERGAELSDVHAWQARHIVQVIRRAGRK